MKPSEALEVLAPLARSSWTRKMFSSKQREALNAALRALVLVMQAQDQVDEERAQRRAQASVEP